MSEAQRFIDDLHDGRNIDDLVNALDGVAGVLSWCEDGAWFWQFLDQSKVRVPQTGHEVEVLEPLAEVPPVPLLPPVAAEPKVQQLYPVGTRFKTRGKFPRLCEVIDFHVTRNLAGEVVKRRYVVRHRGPLGQWVTDYDVPETTIAMGTLAKPPAEVQP